MTQSIMFWNLKSFQFKYHMEDSVQDAHLEHEATAPGVKKSSSTHFMLNSVGNSKWESDRSDRIKAKVEK